MLNEHLLTAMVCVLGVQSLAWGADDATSWRLSTDDTAMVVAIQKGSPVVTQLSSAKGNANWLLSPAEEILLPAVTQNGASVPTQWKYEGGPLDANSGQLVLRFSNASPALELQSIWQARPGHGPVEHWLTIANQSAAVITVGHQDSLVLKHIAIPPNESMDAWWIKRGAGNATTEGGTLTESVGRNSGMTLTSDPTDGASPVPWLAMQVGTSRGCYVGWEFSGIGRIHLRGNGDGESTAVAEPGQIGIEVGNVPAFKTDVVAGEWDGMFYWSPSLEHGTLYIFRPNSDAPAQSIVLRGLEPGTSYKVRTEDHSTREATYTGQELMSSGLAIHLPDKYTTDLVYLEAVH